MSSINHVREEIFSIIILSDPLVVATMPASLSLMFLFMFLSSSAHFDGDEMPAVFDLPARFVLT